MLMQALTGTFAPGDNQRYADRRVLRLEAQLTLEDARQGALVHNLSKTGLLIAADTGLAIGEKIAIALADGEVHAAEVVWADAGLFGCRFDAPLSQSSVSAAMLRSQPVPKEAEVVSEPVAQFARLKQYWAAEGDDLSPAGSAIEKLPLATRGWTIIGLSAACWALAGGIAFLLI